MSVTIREVQANHRFFGTCTVCILNSGQLQWTPKLSEDNTQILVK